MSCFKTSTQHTEIVNNTEEGPYHRLRGMRTYLCGSMDRIPGGGVQWRQEITPVLNELGVVCMNPCDKPYLDSVESIEGRAQRHAAKAKGDLKSVAEHMVPICETDIYMVNVSDFVIASIDTSVHMCGSYYEIALANLQKKPILCWIRQGKNETPDWLLGRLPTHSFFSTSDELIRHLRLIDKIVPGTSVEADVILPRWQTPRFDMLYDPAILNLQGV